MIDFCVKVEASQNLSCLDIGVVEIRINVY